MARYFVDCVEEVGGCPSLKRTDCQTENVETCITATLPERKKTESRLFSFREGGCVTQVNPFVGRGLPVISEN